MAYLLANALWQDRLVVGCALLLVAAVLIHRLDGGKAPHGSSIAFTRFSLPRDFLLLAGIGTPILLTPALGQFCFPHGSGRWRLRQVSAG